MVAKKWSFYKAFCILIILIFFRCTTQKLSQNSFDYVYNKNQRDLNAKFTVFHLNDSISNFFYNFSNEHFLYKKADTSENYFSNIKLSLKIISEDDINNIKDTLSTIIYDKRQENNLIRQLKGDILIKLKQGSNYYINIELTDINKKINYSCSTIFIDKLTPLSRQNFLITNKKQDVFCYNYYKPFEEIVIHTHLNQDTSYQIDYFKTQFGIASPPFSSEQMPHFSYIPDSSFTVYSYNKKINITLPEKGFYHLKTNHTTKDGVTFFVFDSVFPKIKNTENMIFATRYIMAKKEFDECMTSLQKKTSVDKFWINIGGNTEKAKELLKKYYTRVQDANIIFSSFKEGWKTDRGMMYIVLGPPNKVSKTKFQEIWTYGELNNRNSITFSFVKVINPFTDNDYYLLRNEMLKDIWYQAVDAWRQGKVYLDNQSIRKQ